ncbi:MAG: DinB family protein [Planctomycetota bacterium]
MKATDILLMEFDHAWRHDWECLYDAVAGLTEAEADWQAAAYRKVPREEGWPLPGSVRWQVAHIAHCKRYYTAMLRAIGKPDRPPEVPREPCETLDDELSGLRDAHAAQRAAIAALGESDLARLVPNGVTAAEFVVTCTRHDIWHAGQIVVARRLWRERKT